MVLVNLFSTWMKFALSFAILVMLSLTGQAASANEQTLVYRGTPFDSFGGNGPEYVGNEFTPANSVTTYLTISTPLGSNFNGEITDIESFLVTDGFVEFTSDTPYLLTSFEATTDANGELVLFSGTIVQPSKGTIADDFRNTVNFGTSEGDSVSFHKCASDSAPEFCAAFAFTAEEDWFFRLGIASQIGRFQFANAENVPMISTELAGLFGVILVMLRVRFKA